MADQYDKLQMYNISSALITWYKWFTRGKKSLSLLLVSDCQEWFNKPLHWQAFRVDFWVNIRIFWGNFTCCKWWCYGLMLQLSTVGKLVLRKRVLAPFFQPSCCWPPCLALDQGRRTGKEEVRLLKYIDHGSIAEEEKSRRTNTITKLNQTSKPTPVWALLSSCQIPAPSQACLCVLKTVFSLNPKDNPVLGTSKKINSNPGKTSTEGTCKNAYLFIHCAVFQVCW